MLRRATAVVLLLAFASASLLAQTAAGEDCSVPKANDLVVNFYRVDSDLYRGGRPAYRDDVYQKFAELGIRTVVNLEGGDQAKRERAVVERVNQKLAADNKLEFISFPIDSFTETMIGAPSNKNMTALFSAMQNAPKPIYLHCKHGKDRTGMVVLLYRLWRGEESFQDAYDEARFYHFSFWNFGLKRTLERYRNAEAVQSLGTPPATASAGVCKPIKPASAAPVAHPTPAAEPKH
jgi:tyrosine-protein phosphatase SIW14